MQEKICNKCGRKLPLEKFRLMDNKESKPYYLGQCKECEYIYQRKYLEKKNEIQFADDLELLIDIQYKKIIPERILDISELNIIPMGTDEIFVKMTDYRNYYLSNYGRCIRYKNGKYNMLAPNYDDNGACRYSVAKDTYIGGQWIYKREALYASHAVVREFVVNPDIKNNVYIWHSGYNKEDNYYRNLYPLNQKQYQAVKNHFMKTGNDSIWFIMNAINDVRFKPDDWSKRCMVPTLEGVGYRGSENVDCKSKAYLRWSDMMSRCYNAKLHEIFPQYEGSEVCEEWKNFSNYKIWYDSHWYAVEDEQMDVDKDILFKGNKLYSPATCCVVPHSINTLFLSCAKKRGELPVGVWFDKDKGKIRTAMSYCGHTIKLGTFNTPEEAFARYKVYKEDFIKDIAERNKKVIPNHVYEAMKSWKIEIED